MSVCKGKMREGARALVVRNHTHTMEVSYMATIVCSSLCMQMYKVLTEIIFIISIGSAIVTKSQSHGTSSFCKSHAITENIEIDIGFQLTSRRLLNIRVGH